MNIITRGAGSVIVKSLEGLPDVVIEPVDRMRPVPMDGNYYLFAQGWHNQKHFRDCTDNEIYEIMWTNCFVTMREIEWLIDDNVNARIVVMGSDSAFKWSHVGAYAAAKLALQRYIETKRMKSPNQQLVCIAPSMIATSGMVERRNDDGKEALQKRLQEHPKGRMVDPEEVASLIRWLLGPDGSFVSGVTIRMNGGEHCQA